MTPFAFDTLSASKQLREAGMSEGVAEAVVSVFQHASAMPDISHLATRVDLEALSLATRADFKALSLATKADLETLSLATRADFARTATREGLEALRKEMATKDDFAQVRLEIANLRADLYGVIRQQGWMLLGGVAMLLTISTAVGRAIG